MFDAAGEETAAEDEKDVGEDRTEHGRLDYADFAIFKRNDADLRARLAPRAHSKVARAYNQFDGVSERRIEQTS